MENFNNVVSEVLGELEIKGEHKQIAQHLIQSEDDLQALLSNVGQASGGNMHTAVRMFQNQKREENLSSFNQFVSVYNEDEKKALEDLFKQPLSNAHIKLFTESNISLEALYERYTSNLTVQFVPFIRFWDQPTKEMVLFEV